MCHIPNGDIAGSLGMPIFSFRDISKQVSKIFYNNLHSYQQCLSVPAVHILNNTWHFLSF